MELDGFFYKFKVEYINGPFDGMKGVVINFDENKPPKHTFEKIVSKMPDQRTKIGFKLLQEWSKKHTDPQEKVAVYSFSEKKKYIFQEITTFETFLQKYN